MANSEAARGGLEMTREPSISVVIPAYNRERMIGRALRSVQHQRLGAREVILVDDASTDGTLETARAMMPEIRIFRQPRNAGPAAARNVGLAAAAGEWIAFLDSDDEWLPDKLSRQWEALCQDPALDVCATGHWLQRAEGTRREVLPANPPDWTRALHSAQSFHGASTPLVRKALADRVGGQDE
ncbi:MAG TPA: glycosyltransferase family 2 protein, partial [Chthoniobacterales bacterium]